MIIRKATILAGATLLSVFLFPGASMANDENVAQSRAAIKALGGELQTRLKAAMQAGGPVEAIGVCNLDAPGVAGEISEALGLEVGRTTLKLRNPENQPDEWETAVLESFEKRVAEGEDPASIDFSETLATADGEVFRYMKAIPTGGVCLACHGTEVSAEVDAKLQELYPQDQARGYSAGQLRGAFTVSKSL